MERLRAEKILTNITGKDHLVIDIKSVNGGDISDSWAIETDEESLFLKKNSMENKHLGDAEWKGLKELNKCKSIRTPKCYGTIEMENHSYLLLEHLNLRAHNSESMKSLGTNLAKMHKVNSEKFGFHENNYIGSTPQVNHWSNSWIDFYINCRIIPQAYMLGDDFIETKAELLASKLETFFKDYTPLPSLLHGDLWSGNTGSLPNNTPVIYDPSVYYGDRETDIAMTEMFGGFSPEFYKAYNQEWPLNPGYSKRKNLYILYHSLNHANMFGGSYIDQSKHLLKNLCR